MNTEYRPPRDEENLSVPNAGSVAWQKICEIAEGPNDVLRTKYGIHFSLEYSARSPVERVFEANNSILTLRYDCETIEICASITNDGVPQGRLPKPRRFSVEGSIAEPLLAEGVGNPREIEPVFADIAGWFVKASRTALP